MPSVVRHGQGLTVKYSDYVRQGPNTIFIHTDREVGTVWLIVRNGNETLLRQPLSPVNARAIALYLQTAEAKLICR